MLDYLTLDQLAARMSVHKNTLRNWLQKGMPYYKIGGSVRVKGSEFEEWFQQFSCTDTPKEDIDAIFNDVFKEVRK